MLHRPISILLALAILGLWVGCSPASVEGAIEGEEVGEIRSALFDETTFWVDDLNIEVRQATVVLTGMGGGCAAFQRTREGRPYTYGSPSDGMDCVEQCRADIAHMVSVGTTDPFWVLSHELVMGEVAVDTYDHEPYALSPAAFDSTAIRAAILAESDCPAVCQNPVAVETYPIWADSTAGEFEVAEYAEGDRIGGTFEIEFEGDLISGEFEAEHCEMFDEE
jgi:hypothetical protein